MASCELCGKTASTKAKIEGAIMSVCESCASFGTPLVTPKKPLSGRGISSLKAEEGTGYLPLDFGQKLRHARQRMKLTEEDAAKKLQIHKSTLLHFEAGKLQPDEATRKKLEKFYNLSLLQSL